MTWLIGIDEAGYGPNLGPLVIGASAWRTLDQAAADLYETLSAAVTTDPSDERLAVADSKQLYKPGGGWRLLERGVLGAIATTGETPQDSANLLTLLQAEEPSTPPSPWRRDEPLSLPEDATQEEVAHVASQLAGVCQATNLGAPLLRARLVQPDEFNDLVEQHGTKGAALSHVSLGLLRRLIDSLDDATASIQVVLDKHSGRNRYGSLIQHHFPEDWIETLEESRQASRYRTGRIELAFRTKGEAFLPTALASMTAKLLREIEMRRFNVFWQGHLPDLKPTAGYPVDAKRFKAQIAAKQAELKIDDHTLWRCR